MTKKKTSRAVPVWMRPNEHADVERAAKADGLTVSAYIRRAVQTAGGFDWQPLAGRGEYKRTKKEGK